MTAIDDATTPQADSYKPMSWMHFVRRTGDDGIVWSDRLKAEGHFKTLAAIPRALGLLRERKIEAGRALLDKIDDRIAPVEATWPSGYSVLRRFYYAAEAYYFYLLEDYDAAHRVLTEADQHIGRFITHAPFLLPLATACKEFHIQHARVSRNRRDWDRMWHHIGLVRQMMHGDEPLCVLDNGTAIGYPTILDFYETLPGGLSEAERSALSMVIDEGQRIKDFERYLPMVYTPPQFLIPY